MLSIWAVLSPLTPYFISFIAFLLFLEQITYLKKKRYLPGPTLVFPFLGNVIWLVTNPTKFWDLQSSYAKSINNGISVNYIIGRFILYIHSSDLSHRIFTNVRPDAFHLIGHPFGKKLFGEHNLIYMFGQEHKDLRRRIAPNFTPKTLSTYTTIQQKIILKHLQSWLQKASINPTESIPLRILCRDMNLETSQTVFVGPYLSEESRTTFNVDYNYFNVGLMKLPLDFPGFAFRNARLAVDRLINTLSVCAEKSGEKIEKGEEPVCLIDYWMEEALKETNANDQTQQPYVYTNKELGGYLFDFLFAAQDASTSSLLWAVTLLDSYPKVLNKVRLEVAKYWSPENEQQHLRVVLQTLRDQELYAKFSMLREMKYLEAVAREVVRIRAPATMVPHIAGEEFKLTDDYVIPKGTIVFPSVFDSSFQGFTEPDKFDPDRFMEERQEDRVYKKNFLVFGAGPHQCVGQRYAISHLMLFIAMFTALIDFKRDRTDGCDEISYIPTIVPKDDCRVFLSQRCTRFPSA